ncbi:MAG TPA: hypothetical protein DDW30_09000 [Clostridiales bacterium]|nr:hypothetical protein [Clostridiales bacterium]
MFRKLWEKVKTFFRWIFDECRDWRTVVLLIAVIAVVYSPVWGGYLLKLIFGWNWAAVMATAVLVFWAGPFTPFFPICIALTLAIKKWWEKRKKK